MPWKLYILTGRLSHLELTRDWSPSPPLLTLTRWLPSALLALPALLAIIRWKPGDTADEDGHL